MEERTVSRAKTQTVYSGEAVQSVDILDGKGDQLRGLKSSRPNRLYELGGSLTLEYPAPDAKGSMLFTHLA